MTASTPSGEAAKEIELYLTELSTSEDKSFDLKEIAAIIERHCPSPDIAEAREKWFCAEARRVALEEAAKIADAHRGAAERNRRAKGWSLTDETQSEERGEDIAAEIIAREIRKLAREALASNSEIEPSSKSNEIERSSKNIDHGSSDARLLERAAQIADKCAHTEVDFGPFDEAAAEAARKRGENYWSGKMVVTNQGSQTASAIAAEIRALINRPPAGG